jgi:anti-sigma-K factor RskA
VFIGMSDESDIIGENEDSVLVAEYVLGLLEAPEHDRMVRRVSAEPHIRQEVAFWQSRLSSLDAAYVDQQVPAAVLRRIEERLFGGASNTKTSIWQSLALWRGLAGAALAVAVVAVAMNLAVPRQDAQSAAAQLVAALGAEGSDVSFVALYDGSSGKVRLVSLSGSAVPDKDYELWAIEDGKAPMSMGVVAMNARTERPIPDAAMPDFGEGTVLAITLEPKGGSPTGKPTGAVVAKGQATAI